MKVIKQNSNVAVAGENKKPPHIIIRKAALSEKDTGCPGVKSETKPSHLKTVATNRKSL